LLLISALKTPAFDKEEEW
jgi:hypothetical protein